MMVIGRIQVQRHVRPAVMFAISLFVSCQAFASQIQRTANWHFCERALFLATEGHRFASADLIYGPRHAFDVPESDRRRKQQMYREKQTPTSCLVGVRFSLIIKPWQ